jgi:anthranilate synthase component 2
MRIILIDNYDSFTWNIGHYLEQCNCQVDVVKNDAAVVPNWMLYDGCVISPGPGLPEDSGNLLVWMSSFPESFPVLGVCLGLQAMVVFTGGNLINLSTPLHGQEGVAISTGVGEIWKEMNVKEVVAHYHSWVADSVHLPAVWKVSFVSEDNLIMAIEHVGRNWSAVQFHPESILSNDGIRWFQFWLQSFR